MYGLDGRRAPSKHSSTTRWHRSSAICRQARRKRTPRTIVAAYQLTLLANASANAADIIRQNGMINAINDASEIIGQKAMIRHPFTASGCPGYRADQCRLMNFAKMAEDAYHSFATRSSDRLRALPHPDPVAPADHGMGTMRVLQGYLFTLVWIQLWPVVYAIPTTCPRSPAPAFAATADGWLTGLRY